MQTILLLKSAFLCVFRFFGLSSFDTVTTLILSRLASFIPFFEVIPEILSNIVTYAQKENNPFTEIALTQAKRKDPISKGDTPISRSIIQTANAYLYNNTVCVDFNEVLPNVTITLINESTSKLIHSEAYNEPTNIDITLDEGYSSGNYLIKIESDEVLLYGYFSL